VAGLHCEGNRYPPKTIPPSPPIKFLSVSRSCTLVAIVFSLYAFFHFYINFPFLLFPSQFIAFSPSPISFLQSFPRGHILSGILADDTLIIILCSSRSKYHEKKSILSLVAQNMYIFFNIVIIIKYVDKNNMNKRTYYMEGK
jgi:hypothetical protein